MCDHNKAILFQLKVSHNVRNISNNCKVWLGNKLTIVI